MNKDEHVLGALISNFVYWMIPLHNGIAALLISSIFALWGGLAPDALEPPTWRGHRGGWHYFAGPISILPAIFFVNSDLILFVIGAFCVGYFSHFILDIL
ncbi:MAG: hypothetical protein OEW62_02305 [Candidatus Bathyarchaeota archaeon]|nr:hypothetical protein [Candidatus Bathyarchaeota archaeon]MDH5734168.1 hypothetical protein [Candidatus Bathyarchaeota archaeon]